jgi:esterase/lipase superfamily enzyme
MDSIVVQFATNRNRVSGDGLFGIDFRNAKDPSDYVTGSIRVERKSDLPDSGWVPDAATLVLDSANEGVATVKAAASEAASASAADTGIVAFAKSQKQAEAGTAALAPAGANAGYGLVLLPGFASTFLTSVSRAAQLAAAYQAANVFCFSWPANGVVTKVDYRRDRVDAEKSGLAIARSLARLFAFVGAAKASERPRLNIVAHSMGNFALRHAMQHIKKVEPDLLAKVVFEGALLMAADDDEDALSSASKLAPLLGIAKRTTVYSNGGDLALGGGAWLNLKRRLGHEGPKNLVKLPAAITWIDCSAVGRTSGDGGAEHWGHQYYRLSPQVIRDVAQVLKNLKPADINPRLKQFGPLKGRAFIIPFDENADKVVIT